ncbi:hypothetical protein DFO77_11568 [Marinilabilia salmonicolor]|uniref:Uncharacterized protein n=1 Tax=Marinilabilia salmonicolor TaxID=989 RepID=A0A368UV29_9BACT|nr:hypothetical protein DFO77_11568 [Marinilabilia salmonicolor]
MHKLAIKLYHLTLHYIHPYILTNPHTSDSAELKNQRILGCCKNSLFLREKTDFNKKIKFRGIKTE